MSNYVTWVVPYVLYGVKYIDLVSLEAKPVNLKLLDLVMRFMFCMVLNI